MLRGSFELHLAYAFSNEAIYYGTLWLQGYLHPISVAGVVDKEINNGVFKRWP
jgi:hypothetical protein